MDYNAKDKPANAPRIGAVQENAERPIKGLLLPPIFVPCVSVEVMPEGEKIVAGIPGPKPCGGGTANAVANT